MHNFSYGYEPDHKNKLNLYISNQKETNNFKVLDVGGAVGPWFWDNTDVIFDLIPPTSNYGTTFNGEYISGSGIFSIHSNGICVIPTLSSSIVILYLLLISPTAP